MTTDIIQTTSTDAADLPPAERLARARHAIAQQEQILTTIDERIGQADAFLLEIQQRIHNAQQHIVWLGQEGAALPAKLARAKKNFAIHDRDSDYEIIQDLEQQRGSIIAEIGALTAAIEASGPELAAMQAQRAATLAERQEVDALLAELRQAAYEAHQELGQQRLDVIKAQYAELAEQLGSGAATLRQQHEALTAEFAAEWPNLASVYNEVHTATVDAIRRAGEPPPDPHAPEAIKARQVTELDVWLAEAAELDDAIRGLNGQIDTMQRAITERNEQIAAADQRALVAAQAHLEAGDGTVGTEERDADLEAAVHQRELERTQHVLAILQGEVAAKRAQRHELGRKIEETRHGVARTELLIERDATIARFQAAREEVAEIIAAMRAHNEACMRWQADNYSLHQMHVHIANRAGVSDLLCWLGSDYAQRDQVVPQDAGFLLLLAAEFTSF